MISQGARRELLMFGTIERVSMSLVMICFGDGAGRRERRVMRLYDFGESRRGTGPRLLRLVFFSPWLFPCIPSASWRAFALLRS